MHRDPSRTPDPVSAFSQIGWRALLGLVAALTLAACASEDSDVPSLEPEANDDLTPGAAISTVQLGSLDSTLGANGAMAGATGINVRPGVIWARYGKAGTLVAIFENQMAATLAVDATYVAFHGVTLGDGFEAARADLEGWSAVECDGYESLVINESADGPSTEWYFGADRNRIVVSTAPAPQECGAQDVRPGASRLGLYLSLSRREAFYFEEILKRSKREQSTTF